MTQVPQCIVELCEKPANVEAFCDHHRKKYVASQLQVDMSVHKIWDVCSKGHRWTEANIHWEGIPGKPSLRRRCRKCLALKSAKRRKNADGTTRPPLPYRPENIEMAQAIDSFDEMLTVVTAKCKGEPGPWTEYTSTSIPTAEEASLLCKGCPLFQGCANAAYVQTPGWGVWAGEVWLYGSLFTESKRDMLHEED